MTDSLLPPSDREWLVDLIRRENEKIHTKISELALQVKKLDDRQRDSAETDLDHERRIADAQLRLERISATSGAEAGKESAEATSKKWGVIYALIALATTITNTLIGAKHEPVIPPVKEEIRTHAGKDQIH